MVTPPNRSLRVPSVYGTFSANVNVSLTASSRLFEHATTARAKTCAALRFSEHRQLSLPLFCTLLNLGFCVGLPHSGSRAIGRRPCIQVVYVFPEHSHLNTRA